MEELRRQTPSLRHFLRTVQWFQTSEDLDQALLEIGVIPEQAAN